MRNGSHQHESASCPHCERVPIETPRRHWKQAPRVGAWHVIADGPDLGGRLLRQAHFLTILSYRLSPDGSQARYQGPLYGEFDAMDPAQAFTEFRRCLELLRFDYDCPLEAIHTWHSGRRGPHWTIPPGVFGAEASHPQLPRIYAAMVQRLFPPSVAPTLDRSIYSAGKGRMWRLPNRRRADNARFKVALSIREVLHKSSADLAALTIRPREGVYWPCDEEISPCLGLVQLYQETVSAIERADSPQPPRHGNESAAGGDVDILLKRCAFIRHCRDDAATLSEPEWYTMVSNVARCANGPAVVHTLSAPYPKYAVYETNAKLAHALHDTGPHTCTFIQAQGFTGCPPGGCGVKAPIGLAYPPVPKGLLHAWNAQTRRQRAVVLAR
jgi:hypothetical protein